jgi:hypothetical protein
MARVALRRSFGDGMLFGCRGPLGRTPTPEPSSQARLPTGADLAPVPTLACGWPREPGMPSSPREERSAGARLRSCSQEMLSIARAAHACKRSIVRQPWVADLADYSRHAPRHARGAHSRHPWHTSPAQPCGFRSAMRVKMGEVGFEPT